MKNQSKNTQKGNIILKNDLKENFTIVSNNLLKDNRLTLTEKGALITLLSLPNNFKITIKATSQFLNISEPTFIKFLENYKNCGYLKATRINNKFTYELKGESPQTIKFNFKDIKSYTIEQLNYFANSKNTETKYKNLILKMLDELNKFKKDIENN